ncbi:MAG: hypothetical protein IPQ09_05300 [Myxococcales bacterium]|nr:hypothetical protein [Myxococcales bacterium]
MTTRSQHDGRTVRRPRWNARRSWRAARGVTLVDVMNLVVVAASVSAVGMYATARYISHTKTTEAVSEVAALGKAAAEYYDTSDSAQPAGATVAAKRAMRRFPASSKDSVPADPLDVRGKRYQSSSADWARSPWKELGFSVAQPQYYAYSFTSEGTGFQAQAKGIARGDLNGNGTRSMFYVPITPGADAHALVGNLVTEDSEE